MTLEDHSVKQGWRQSGRGQIFGFIIAIVVLLLATGLAVTGHEATASVFGGTTIVGLVTVFVLGKKSQK